MSKRKKPVIVHFNDGEKIEVQTLFIGDVYAEIEKLKGLTLDPNTFQVFYFFLNSKVMFQR
jgi:hypothetical protein